eukprot:653662_1
MGCFASVVVVNVVVDAMGCIIYIGWRYRLYILFLYGSLRGSSEPLRGRKSTVSSPYFDCYCGLIHIVQEDQCDCYCNEVDVGFGCEHACSSSNHSLDGWHNYARWTCWTCVYRFIRGATPSSLSPP